MKSIHFAILGACLMGSVPFSAAAQSRISAAAPRAAQQSVSLRDLDLKTPAGAREALQRIKAAAETVCGGQPDPLPLAPVVLFDRCRRTAETTAVTHLSSPLVTAMAAAPKTIRLAAH